MTGWWQLHHLRRLEALSEAARCALAEDEFKDAEDELVVEEELDDGDVRCFVERALLLAILAKWTIVLAAPSFEWKSLEKFGAGRCFGLVTGASKSSVSPGGGNVAILMGECGLTWVGWCSTWELKSGKQEESNDECSECDSRGGKFHGCAAEDYGRVERLCRVRKLSAAKYCSKYWIVRISYGANIQLITKLIIQSGYMMIFKIKSKSRFAWHRPLCKASEITVGLDSNGTMCVWYSCFDVYLYSICIQLLNKVYILYTRRYCIADHNTVLIQK